MKLCKQCNADISQKRIDALFCDERCKKKYRYRNDSIFRERKIEMSRKNRKIRKNSLSSKKYK